MRDARICRGGPTAMSGLMQKGRPPWVPDERSSYLQCGSSDADGGRSRKTTAAGSLCHANDAYACGAQ